MAPTVTYTSCVHRNAGASLAMRCTQAKEYARSMFVGAISPETLLIIVIALAVIFGGSQLPKIARNVGGAGREFRKAQQEAAAEEEEAKRKAEAAAPPAVTAAPLQSPVVTPPVQPVATPAPSDSITLSKADLEALLDAKLKGQQSAN
jgi:sec-independent protein translocase protein TatA